MLARLLHSKQIASNTLYTSPCQGGNPGRYRGSNTTTQLGHEAVNRVRVLGP